MRRMFLFAACILTMSGTALAASRAYDTGSFNAIEISAGIHVDIVPGPDHRVVAETGRIYSIVYSERFENRATVRAGELVKAGAIGRVVQTIGLGPHRINIPSRPEWFFHKARYGGILCDIASHQADQFLFFTGSTTAEVVASQVGNVHYRQYPEFEDFGDMMVRGNGGTGYIRVDWFTPDGLPTWGDGRLTVLGTDGFIEVRKNVDIAGRPGGSHLFISDTDSTRCPVSSERMANRAVASTGDSTTSAPALSSCLRKVR